MHPMKMNQASDKADEPKIPMSDTAGQTLKKIFHQGYSFPRIDEQHASESMLMNPLRLAIFTELSESPCDHTRSIARKLGNSLSSINWNLGQLLGRGYLESCTVDGKKAYWPTGMVEKEDVLTVSMLRIPWVIRTLGAVHEAQNIRQRDLVSAMGEKQQVMEFRLRKMLACGILDSPGMRYPRTYFVNEDLMRRTMHYRTRARQVSKEFFEIFRKDGLMPGSRRLRNTRLSVDIRLPSGKITVHLECDPMANARKLLARRL